MIDDDTKVRHPKPRDPSPSNICVDRCVCFDVTFAELKEIADNERVSTIPDLMEHAAFGLACQSCHPYVRSMLKTGTVVFDALIDDDDD